MNAKHAELYRRIAGFNIDEPGVRLPFTARLARENGWNPDYARRVVEEYKKFIFLAMAAGHSVTPSEHVDQAWHFHLVYTRSYWEDFCGKVLGRPLHHGPTKGGHKEQTKYVDWYERTKQSYRRLFECEPPVDIWPDAKTRFGDDLHYYRVNTKRNWIIRKPRLKWLAASWVLLIGGLSTVVGCVAQHGGDSPTASPRITAATVNSPLEFFDLPGPQFLGFFAGAFVVAVCVATIVRWYMRRSDPTRPGEVRDLDPYEVAYLAGGEEAAINAALASLVSRGEFEVHGEEHRLTRHNDRLSHAVHPLEEAIFDGVDADVAVSIDELHGAWPPLVQIADRLKSLGLVVSDEHARMGVVLPVLVVLAVPLFGAIKILVGLSRDKPVGYLVMGCIIAVVVAFAVFGQKLLRTWEGNRLLEHLKEENSSPAVMQEGRRGDLVGPDLALALGLFGIGVLEAGPLAELHAALKPRSESGSWGGCGGDGGGCGGGCGGCGGCG